jgi:hypothetical protein
MKLYAIILIVAAVIFLVIGIVLLSYYLTASYQQKITLTVPFENTYRFTELNKTNACRLDTIKITITGKIPKGQSTIIPSRHIEQLIQENIIIPSQNSMFILESDIFSVNTDSLLHRIPMVKDPTLENLSIHFYNKLSPLISKLGCQLMAVRLSSNGIKVIHSREKMSYYTH